MDIYGSDQKASTTAQLCPIPFRCQMEFEKESELANIEDEFERIKLKKYMFPALDCRLRVRACLPLWCSREEDDLISGACWATSISLANST